LGLGKSETILQPNQKATFDKQNNSVEISNEPYAELYIAWTEGWLQFSKESLHSVFNKLERYYNIDVIIPLNFPPSEIITGKLDLKESLEDVMVTLTGVADIEYRIAGNKIYIDRKIKEIKKRK
jgi:transmembrane sensor